MKYIDKLIKILKTDRNTFFTYILTLFTAYFFIDRVVEILIMCFTGMSVSYWGPIKYTIVLACPTFAFFLSFSSKFAKGDNKSKLSFFITYCIALYVIGISMAVQSFNHLSWLLIMSLPNYEEIIMEFSDLIRPAFTSVAIAIPLTTFYPLVKWLYIKIKDPIYPNTFLESIYDYSGISIAPGRINSGQYSYEINLCKDRGSGKASKITEDRRFQGTLVLGPTGVGKTSMVMHPLIAQDLEKKYFFNEIGKEMGYTALKTGIATLNCPYDNEYLNNNFRLSMLTPAEGKEQVYKAYMKKMIDGIDPDGTIIYRDLGLTYLSPDPEDTKKVESIAKAFNIPVQVIDPSDINSPGINPFSIRAPVLCALAISSVLKSLYDTQNTEPEEAYMQNAAHQAIQNLVILLKAIYPKLNNGDMPNLDDLLKCFTNFDYVEYLCEELKKFDELKEENYLTLSYFEEYFYKSSEYRAQTKKFVHFAAAQLDYLLKVSNIRPILCKRNNNIDYEAVVKRGDVIILCSQLADIGGLPHKGLSRFFLFLIEIAMENRGTREYTKIPHFVYIDEFDTYAFPPLTDFFTLGRKFNVGTTISAQTLVSMSGTTDSGFAQVILANSPTKLSFGNCTPEDYDWWEKEFEERREWVVANNYDSKNEEYGTSLGAVSWTWKMNLQRAKQQGLAFKEVVYKLKAPDGKNKVGFGSVDFLPSKYNEQHKSKKYAFDSFNTATADEGEKQDEQKFDPNKIDFGEGIDPVQTDTTDSSYFFDNEDAISFNLNGDKTDN